jgi:hypothetical protein
MGKRNYLAFFRLSAIKGTLFLFLFNKQVYFHAFDDFSLFNALQFKYKSIQKRLSNNRRKRTDKLVSRLVKTCWRYKSEQQSLTIE